MDIDIVVGDPGALETPLLVLPWCQGADREAERPGDGLEALDESLGLALTRAVTGGDFRARRGEGLLLYRRGEAGPDRVLLTGVGERGDLTPERLRECGGRAVRRAGELGLSELSVWLSPDLLGGAADAQVAARAFSEGAVLGQWRFDELRSEPPDDDHRPALESLALALPTANAGDAARSGAELGSVLAAAQNYARELAIRPGNIVNPKYLADEARRLGVELGLKVTILDREMLKKDGMEALLAVAQGSEEEPFFIALERCPDPDARPLVLVGKGVTFDSGGLSLKPSSGMEHMKYDMSGAAAVLGALRAIAQLGLPANVVGLIPAVENMPSGRAVRPGDIIGSRSRKTIEVVNTDAEGRLILADALNYAARYEPEALIDIATLTGSCVVALGAEAIGLLGNDAALIDEIRAAGDRCGERVWQLPLWDEYRELIKSDVADIKNSGGRPAGTISAAMFLREFVGPYPWAHLDIAGTAWAEKAGPYRSVGPTGVGVRLFTEWVRGRVG
ncbi:MAG: leucyl aminopeptidase [Gemmatimonadota bacterium]|nr:MAG: leucyl aminopeptidase [Gemmatimonadota bacterium]